MNRFFHPKSIRSRLLLIFVLLVFLPTAIISIFSATANLRDGRNQVINQLESVASLKEDAIEDWINTLHNDLNVELARKSTRPPLLTILQTSPGDSEYQAAQAAKIDHFNQMLDLTQSFEEILLLDRKGEVILSTDADQQGKLFARHDFFEEGMESPYVQPPLYYVTYGKSAVMVAHPVKDDQGKSLGVLVGRANLERLSEIMLERSGLGETGETYLVGTNKSMLTRSRFADDIDYVRTEGTQAAIDDRTNGSGIYEDYRGESVLGVYQWLPELEVALMAEQDRTEAFQGVYRSIIGNVVVALMSLGAAVGVGLVATNRIANPLTSLTDTVAQFAEGKVEARAQVKSEDEIGTLASSFNRMAEQIGGLLDRVQTRSEELTERSRELEASQRVTFAASEHVSPNELLDLVVNLIRDQFGLYHAQVYIVDEEQEAAVLRQSTGYAGRQLLQQNHQIGLDETALVTRAIHEGEPQLVDDTKADPDFMANPLLPDTRSELVVPLKREDQVIGVLDVQDREPERFSESTVNLFRSMADQVAMLFENAELLERVTDQTERLTTFTNQLRTATQIARRLNTILDPDRLAEETVEMLQSRFGLYHAHIYLLDEEAGQLNMHIGSGEVGRVLREQGHTIDLSAEKSLVVRAALGRHTITVDDTSLESDFMPNPLLPETRSEVAVPLIVGDDVLGVLDVQDNEPNRFSEADVDTLGILAGQIATAMQTATLFEQTQTRLRVSQALTEARTEDEVLDVMIEQAAFYPQAQVALMLVDKDADEFTTEIVRADAAKSGLPNLPMGTRFTQETLPALQYLSATEDFIVNDIETDERMDPESRGFMKQMGIHSGANIPVAIGDNWLGLLVVNARQANFFEEQKLTLYRTLAEQGAGALQIARLNEATAESEQRLSLMVEQTPLAVIEWNTDFEVVSWNPAAQEIFGYTEKEAMGRHAAGLIVPEEARPHVNRVWEGLLNQTGGTRSTNENFTKDGRQIMCDWYNAPLVDSEGNVLGVTSLVADITARVEAERQTRIFQSLAENAVDAFTMTDFDGKVTYANRSTYELLGYDYEQDELIGSPVSNLASDEEKNRQAEAFQQIMETGGGWSGEVIVSRKDGSTVDVSLTMFPILDEDGNPISIAAILRDITARKQAEEAIRESEQRLSLMVEQSPLAVIEWNTDFEVASWNRAAEEIFGYTEEEAMGRHAAGLMVPEEVRPLVNQVWEDVLHQRGGTRSTNENFTKDGRAIMCEWYNAPLVDAEGNTLGVASLVSDITARVEAERAMQRTRASVENAESAFFWFDVDTNFTDVSDRTCEMLGYPREQLLEMRVFDIDPVFPEEAWPGLREQVKETGSVTLESRHRTQQGREFPVQVTVSYLEFGGEDIYFAVAQDITERQQAEEERERFTTRLETAAEISEQTGAILDPDELLQTVIPLIKERFGLYYVHVYTLDEESGMLNLRAGYGEAGETMLAEGHAIPVGREASLVARAARTKEPVMVDDVTDNPNFMPNPLLPDTKTEVAVPAIAGGQVLGVFDVQHDQAQYFTEADLDVFLTLAGQIANTFHSASLLGEQQRAEAAMRQERDFADTAINSLPGIFYMYNMQSQLVRWNQNFPDVLGYSEDELVQMSVTDFIPEPDRELISSKMQQVFTEGATTVESAVLTKDGEVIPYYFTGIRAQVEGESYLVGVGIDITDRKQAEEAIRESERQLSAAMQLADMATWEFDVPTQTFLFNDNYYETFADATAEEVGGYEMTAEEFAQRFVPPIDAGKVGENIQQALETDDPDFQLQMESRNLTLDGEQRWTSVWFRVEKDEEGRTTKLHGVNQDITERKQTEAERARLTTIMDSTSDLVSISTPEGKLEYMNEAGREMLGWADEESIADRDITEVYPEWALEIAGNVGLPTAIEKGIWQGEAAILGPDGSEVPVSQVIMAHRSPDSGDLEYISTIMRDITERVRAERQIRESEQRLSLLVEQSPLAVIEWNTDFEVASWNPAAEEIFGYTEEEAMGRHAAGLMVPEEVRPLVNQVWEDVLHQQGGTRSTNENFTKEGRTIMCEWYNAPMVDQDGNTLGVASLVSDITARVEAEQARERFTEQLRTAADLAEDISAILDPDRLLNRVVDELQSRFNLYHVHVYLTGDDRNELIMQAGSGEVGQQMLAEGHTIPWDEAQSLVARAARTKKIVSVSNTKKETGFLPNPLLPETRSEVAIPLVAGEKVLGVLDVQDSQVERFSESDLDIFSTLAGQIAIALQNADFVEELNETAERLREVDRLKSEFLASMSHELRTPLNSIIGYTEIMLMGIDQELSEETMEDVQAIYDNSQQLLAIINDVLDLARIEAGRLEMEMNEVNVTDVINAAQKSAEGLLVDDVIDFIVEAEEDLPTIWGDQRRIDQILNNLVSNAIKFTEEGYVALRAYADDHTVCLAVEDTGVGIAEEDQDRIFERFEQLNQTVTKQRQGTGLGLAITRELVELHGGTLEVESELGTGSTFTIRLPVKQA